MRADDEEVFRQNMFKVRTIITMIPMIIMMTMITMIMMTTMITMKTVIIMITICIIIIIVYDNGKMVMMEDTYLPAGIYAGCAGDMNSSQGEGSSW